MFRHESEEFKNNQKKLELEYTQLKRKERNQKYSEKKKLNENKNKKVCSSESEFENMPSAKKAKTANTKTFSTPKPSTLNTQSSSFSNIASASASSSLTNNNHHLNSTPTNAQSTSASSSLANNNQTSASNLSSNDDLDNSICFQDETILDSNNQSNNLVSKQLVFPSNSSNPHLNEKSNQAEEVEVSNLLRMMADEIIKISKKLTSLETTIYDQNIKRSSIVNKSAMSLDDTKVIYKDKNLVTVHAKKMNKYVTAIMRILFTEEELKLGYIIEDKSTSKRTPLDLERIQLLKNAIFAKYHVPEAKKGDVWIEMKSVANRLCMDLSKGNNNNKENSENNGHV